MFMFIIETPTSPKSKSKEQKTIFLGQIGMNVLIEKDKYGETEKSSSNKHWTETRIRRSVL